MDTRIFCNIFDRKYFFHLAAEIRKILSAKHILTIFDSLLPTVEEIEAYDSMSLSKRESKHFSGAAAVFLNLCDVYLNEKCLISPTIVVWDRSAAELFMLQNRCSLLPQFGIAKLQL